MTPPERDPARDAAIDALLPLVPTEGWTVAALRRAAGPDADLLFPGGPVDMVETWCDLADRRMEQAAAATCPDGVGLSGRVRHAILTRLRDAAPHRPAVRRALALLSLPGNAATAAACTARTVDAIWHAAGDHPADFSWYTKRATLGWVYGVTLLYWLRVDDEDRAAAFLDRRLRDVGRIGKLRARLTRRRAR